MGIKLGKSDLLKLNKNELELIREWWKPREGDTVTDLDTEFGYFKNEQFLITNDYGEMDDKGKCFKVYSDEMHKLYPCPDLIMLTEFIRMRLGMENVIIDFSFGLRISFENQKSGVKYKIDTNKITDAMRQMLAIIIDECYKQGILVKEEPKVEEHKTKRMDMFELE